MQTRVDIHPFVRNSHLHKTLDTTHDSSKLLQVIQ